MADDHEALIKFAHHVEPQRAAVLQADLQHLEGSGIAIALATAFDQFYPSTAWKCEAFRQIARDGWRVPRTRDALMGQLTARLPAAADRAATLTAIRRGAWVERARIALRELLPHTLGGAPLLVTTREISWLAEVLLEVACAEARAHVAERYGTPMTQTGEPSEFFVLGLGKLGGHELNAGSDVDLCFIYDTDDGGSRISLHEHWSRVAQRIVQNIELPTDDGSAWRVDLRLRPEGSHGAISNSILASERYYETWGRLWERAALVRARPVAGDPQTGARFVREVVTPFVYHREVDPSVVNALTELLARSQVELRIDLRRDLKLGTGGIREAEFFVQALQLIWGGRERSLQVPGFFPWHSNDYWVRVWLLNAKRGSCSKPIPCCGPLNIAFSGGAQLRHTVCQHTSQQWTPLHVRWVCRMAPDSSVNWHVLGALWARHMLA